MAVDGAIGYSSKPFTKASKPPGDHERGPLACLVAIKLLLQHSIEHQQCIKNAKINSIAQYEIK